MANLLQTCAATCLCSPIVCSTNYVQVGSAGRGIIKLNASYNTLELYGYGNELMIGAVVPMPTLPLLHVIVCVWPLVPR